MKHFIRIHCLALMFFHAPAYAQDSRDFFNKVNRSREALQSGAIFNDDSFELVLTRKYCAGENAKKICWIDGNVNLKASSTNIYSFQYVKVFTDHVTPTKTYHNHISKKFPPIPEFGYDYSITLELQLKLDGSGLVHKYEIQHKGVDLYAIILRDDFDL